MTQAEIDRNVQAIAEGAKKAVLEMTTAFEAFERACANVKLPIVRPVARVCEGLRRCQTN